MHQNCVVKLKFMLLQSTFTKKGFSEKSRSRKLSQNCCKSLGEVVVGRIIVNSGSIKKSEDDM